MKGRAANKSDKVRMRALADLGCIVCLLHLNTWTPPEIHHTTGKTKKGAHQCTLPLCFRHHREGVDSEAYTSRHPYKARFEARYGTEQELLAKVEELLWQRFG